MKNFRTMTVGEIVADDFKNANVFERYQIDFCCNGAVPLPEACKRAGADADRVIEELNSVISETSYTTDFKSWPTDLLVDYVLKFHHRNIRKQGPAIEALLEKISRVHGEAHPELRIVKEQFSQSMVELENHLQKEETVLFPYLYEMCDAEVKNAPAPFFQCESVEMPISVMTIEHDAEGERYRYISELTNGYNAPPDACDSYRLAYDEIKAFEEALHHHIHLENNLIFPRAIRLEKKLRNR